MTTYLLEAALKLQELVMRHGLPCSDYALFGVKCPYCGKIDRVSQLETPEKLQQNMDAEEARMYTEHWHRLARPDHSIGVCTSCHNLLSLNENTDAKPLAE